MVGGLVGQEAMYVSLPHKVVRDGGAGHGQLHSVPGVS